MNNKVMGTMNNLANIELSVGYTNHPPFVGLDEYGIHMAKENWHKHLAQNQNLVDIIIGGFHLNYERFQIYDYVYPYFIDQTSIMTQISTKSKYNADQLLNQFDNSIWLAIVICLICLPLFAIIISYLNPNPNNDSKQRSILDSCSIWFYILFRQNVLNRLKQEQSRSLTIVSIIWIFVTFLLTTFYADYLLSMISIPRVRHINSLRRLSQHCRQNNMIVLMENNTTAMKIVKTMANDTLFAPIVAHLKIVNHQNEAIDLLLQQQQYESTNNQKYAFIQHRTMLKIIQNNYGDRLYLSKYNSKRSSSIYMGLTCFLLKQKFPYLKQFNRITFYLFSSGIYQQWLNNEFRYSKIDSSLSEKFSTNNYYYDDNQQSTSDDDDEDGSSSINNENNPNVDHQNNNNFRSLTLSQIMICFHLYLMALFIDIMVIILEFLWFSYTTTRQ
ncbi:uncharacterized protein LOC113788482 isoform X2 [Dermatophagoides pteronyssinus]|uniref:uncharacterized protein LOC113788482 isoform X2 n=1 Tax=Dermatophagoides pteronyssinus TaxID=6956 RepID=UPI003F665676